MIKHSSYEAMFTNGFGTEAYKFLRQANTQMRIKLYVYSAHLQVFQVKTFTFLIH